MEISRKPAFLKGLYTTELYSIDEKKSGSDAIVPVEQESAAPTMHLGDGSSGVALVLPTDPGEQELALLVKILGSIQIPIASTLQFSKIPENINIAVKPPMCIEIGSVAIIFNCSIPII